MIEVKVGPPVLTINQGRTFLVTTPSGEIEPRSRTGFFAQDTRYASAYHFRLSGLPWTLITSSAVNYFSSESYFTNHTFLNRDGHEVPQHTVSLVLARTLGEALHEDYDITNYSGAPVDFFLEIEIRSDFADLFQVKSQRFHRVGTKETTWNQQDRTLYTHYEYDGFARGLRVQFDQSDTPVSYADGIISFPISLGPGESWHTCVFLSPVLQGGELVESTYGCSAMTGDQEIDRRQRQWREVATKCRTSDEDLNRAYLQSVDDLGALRMYEIGERSPQGEPSPMGSGVSPGKPEESEHSGGSRNDRARIGEPADDVWVPAAGVPWFVTLFGRDSLVVSLQAMTVAPLFARGALAKLAELQGDRQDDWRDEEPGKILHEYRVGPLAFHHLIPHTPYYGTADATILFLVVLSEAVRWTGDLGLFERFRPNVERCLDWIDHRGDLDGDGFQEYRTRSPQGYQNMGWKDAGNAVVYPDGRPVPQPIGTCELQGYVYDAKRRIAALFELAGDRERARALRKEALALKARFHEAFWLEELGTYAFALGPRKDPVASVVSNAGHLLWSGIVDEPYAGKVVERLLAPDMYSGWGIRTLSRDHPAFNPLSYQLGSVWPHDNALIAAGFKRYGYVDEANLVFRGILDAARRFEGYRLPELFAGFQRRTHAFPVQYLGANIPQAWAAASIFQFVATVVGLHADAVHGTLWVDPTLPDWLSEVVLSDLEVGRTKLAIRCWREEDENHFEVLEAEGDDLFVRQGRPPWEAGIGDRTRLNL